MPTASNHNSARATAGLLAALALLAGCGEASAPPADTQDKAAGAAKTAGTISAAYTVNGTIRSLPSVNAPGQELMIAHDEIPGFVGPDGRVVGMRAMTMPFPALADDVSLDGFAIQDTIRFTFVVDYEAEPKYVVTAIEPRTGANNAPEEASEAD